ncbi:hypothetical protein ACJ72_03680 [Emergomyces africanus]|uniref:Rhodopsin domain-containing protein n=1 Tax=Emergomyces africanus TaxID=1955775 RepID=A0A1B7NZC6_9EURO|nr:hypothetical protein ACJ72_03680 [Emergomyces africanus]
MSSFGKSTPGHPSRGWDLWIVSTAMVIVAGLFVCARLLGRYMSGGFQIDDYTIFAALINSVILSITENMAVAHGYGRHALDLAKEEKILALKWFFAAQVFYKIVITLAKMSILFLYMRIFYIERYFRWACTLLNIFIGAHGIAFVLATIWQCHPVAGFWDKSIPGFHCVKRHPFWLSFSVINICTDVVMLVLPVQEVLRLNLHRREKLALVLVFSLGAFVCITSIVRATTLASSSSSKDGTWAAIPATVWSVVECNTGIICACLPMIRQPLSIAFPFFASNSPNSRSTPRSLSFPHNIYMNRVSHVIDPTNSTNCNTSWVDITDCSLKDKPSLLPSSAGGELFSLNSSEEGMMPVDVREGQHGSVQWHERSVSQR